MASSVKSGRGYLTITRLRPSKPGHLWLEFCLTNIISQKVIYFEKIKRAVRWSVGEVVEQYHACGHQNTQTREFYLPNIIFQKVIYFEKIKKKLREIGHSQFDEVREGLLNNTMPVAIEILKPGW